MTDAIETLRGMAIHVNGDMTMLHAGFDAIDRLEALVRAAEAYWAFRENVIAGESSTATRSQEWIALTAALRAVKGEQA